MHKLDEDLKFLILKNVEFQINNKIIKKGKVKIFNTKHFFIKFKLENSEVIKEFELPYPYRIVKQKNGFLFDYCLSAFIPKTEEVYWKIKTCNSSNASKLHDNYLYITTLSS
jgi:hypothetical protein